MTADVADAIIAKHCIKGILVDTNILLLYLVGRFDRDRIRTFKNTDRYDEDDFELARIIIDSFSRTIVTPNILTEVSNLASQLGEPARGRLLKYLGTQVETLDERIVESKSVTSTGEFAELGLTDVGIAKIARDGLAVLTDDLDLYLHLARVGVDVLNFSHLRPMAWNWI